MSTKPLDVLIKNYQQYYDHIKDFTSYDVKLYRDNQLVRTGKIAAYNREHLLLEIFLAWNFDEEKVDRIEFQEASGETNQ